MKEVIISIYFVIAGFFGVQQSKPVVESGPLGDIGVYDFISFNFSKGLAFFNTGIDQWLFGATATTTNALVEIAGDLAVLANATTTGIHILEGGALANASSTMTLMTMNTATTTDLHTFGTGGDAQFKLGDFSLGLLILATSSESTDAWVWSSDSSATMTVFNNFHASSTVIIGDSSDTTTTTIKTLSDASGSNGGTCFEWVNVENVVYREYVSGAGTKVLEAGTCE